MRVFFMSFIVALLSLSFAQAQSGAQKDAAQAVIIDQLDAFKADDAERAYSHASPNVQRLYPRAEYFMAMVQLGYKPIFAHSSYIFGETDLAGEDIVQEVLHTGPDGKAWRSFYLLGKFEDSTAEVPEGGIWKIKGVMMQPDAGGAIL